MDPHGTPCQKTRSRFFFLHLRPRLRCLFFMTRSHWRLLRHGPYWCRWPPRSSTDAVPPGVAAVTHLGKGRVCASGELTEGAELTAGFEAAELTAGSEAADAASANGPRTARKACSISWRPMLWRSCSVSDSLASGASSTFGATGRLHSSRTLEQPPVFSGTVSDASAA